MHPDVITEVRPLSRAELAELADAASDTEAEPPFAMGAALLVGVADETGWPAVWLQIRGVEVIALVSPDRSVALLPLLYADAAFAAGQPERISALLERFELGQRPKGAPGSFAIIE